MTDIAPSLSTVVVWLVGIGLAIRMRRREPRVALAAGISLSTFVLLNAINIGLMFWRRENAESDQLRLAVFLAYNVVGPILSAIAWIVLLAAVFSGRGTSSTPEPAPGKISTSPPPARISREVIVGGFVGGGVGLVLASMLCQEAPFFLVQLGTSTAILVLLVMGWGAVAGAAIAATSGGLRGAITGGVCGIVVLFAWAARQDAEGAAWVLRNCPAWFLLVGIALGWALARGWQILNKN